MQGKPYQSAQRIGIYLSMQGKEIQTNALVEDALERGKSVFVPYIHRQPGTKESEMQMFLLHSKQEYLALSRDKWGIPSLPATSIASRENSFGGKGIKSDPSDDKTLDMIIVPGMAFDFSFRRLGHGKGYYDRFLQRCARAVKAHGQSMPLLGAFLHIPPPTSFP